MKHVGKAMLLTTALALFTVGANAEDYTNQTEQNSSSSSYNMNDNTSAEAPEVNTNSPGASATDTRMKSPDDQSAEAGSGQQQDPAKDAATAAHNSTMSSSGAVNLSKTEVEDIQESLRDEGIAVNVDGMWGPRTMAALEEFQQKNNLNVTGQLDSQTIAALEVDIDDNYKP